MQPLIEQALIAKVPLIHVTSTDLIYVQEVLSFIAGEEVSPLSLDGEGNHCDLDRDLYYTSDDVVSKGLYLEFKNANKSLVYVNTKLSLLQFDAGVLMPPYKMMTNYLQDLIPEYESIDSLVPAFRGMTLKEMFETFKLTDYKVGVITPQDIHNTRRGLITKARGLEQVDIDYEFYQCPSYLGKWLKLNTDFFLNPKVQSLTPRGLLFDGPPGCLDGSTILKYKRGKGHHSISLEQLYLRFNGLPCGKNPPRLKGVDTFLCSRFEDDSIAYNKIVSIIKTGVKPCVTISTALGNTLTLTYDHPICNSEGVYVEAKQFKVGDLVSVQGSMLARKGKGRIPREVSRREICVKYHPIAGTKVVNGCTYKRLHFSRVVIEAHMNKMPLTEYLTRLNNNMLDGLVFLDSSLEVHHLDENRRNDNLSNLVVMSTKDHAQHHGKVKNFANFNTEYIINDSIVSIQDAGDRMTYDIQMDFPNNNFIANNFIVHNTGKTLACKYIAKQWGLPLYRIDIGALKAKYVGESEQFLRNALSQVDTIAPCIVLIDEAEKAFTTQHDSGVTSSLLGSLLWWMQEHTSKVFTVLTTNNKDIIPRELYREGRIDDIMVFKGLENIKDATEFTTQVASNLISKLELNDEIGTLIYKQITNKLQVLFAMGKAIPQVSLIKEVNTIVKQVVSS